MFMTIASASQFHIYLPWVNARSAKCFHSVFNVKALVGAFNQEKALVGAFSVTVKTVKTGCGTDGSFYSTTLVRHKHGQIIQHSLKLWRFLAI